MVRTKVAFVLRILDDFSGKVVSEKKFRFFSKDRPIKTIQKEEGLYVFLEPINDREEIKISHMDFHSCKIQVEKSLLDMRNPIVDVRMYGKKGGNFSKERALVEGTIPKGGADFPAKVCVKRERKTGLSLKEIKEVDNQTHLVVYGLSKEYLIGKTFAMSHEEKTETFVIEEKISMNQYRISGNLKGKYPEKTSIERVYCSITDEQGNYGIFVEKQEQTGEVLLLSMNARHTLTT